MMPLAFIAGQRVPMQATRLVRPTNDPLSTTLVGFSPDEERTEAGGVFTRASGSFSKLLSDRPLRVRTVGTGGGLGPSLPATVAGDPVSNLLHSSEVSRV